METGIGVTNSQPDLRWDLLESQVPTGERLTVRTALSVRHPDVLIAIDASKRRYLLVELREPEYGELAERTSRGIEVRTVELNLGRNTVGRFVEIACLDADGHAALDTIARELTEALEAGATDGRIRLVQNVLAKWRRFWSGTAQGILSKEQQLALFGELWFLNRWLVPSIGVDRAIAIWRGPTGARNDFESPGLAVEVKTTSRVDGAHRIHGLDQLLEPQSGKLLLFSLTVREEASGSENLYAEVLQARELIGQEHSVLAQFETLISAAGYDDRLATEYAKLRLRVRDSALFNVSEGFPRLVPDSLRMGVPLGISAIEYDLRLEAAGPWLLATEPRNAADYLN